MKNVVPTSEESQVQAAKWDAIKRAISWAAFLLALFLGLVVYLAWHTLQEAAPALLIFFIAVIVISSCAGAFNLQKSLNRWSAAKLERYRHNTFRLAPTDFNGNYEVIYHPDTRTLLQPGPGNYQQPVYQTYAPHIVYHNDVEQIPGQEQQALPAPAVQAPDLATIVEELRQNALEFAFGFDPLTGQLVKTTLPKAVHIQLVGASGQGKSRQATSILTQLTTRNDPQHLQLALIDHEGETSAPFQGLPHVQFVADDPKEAARIFRALVRELDRRDIGKIAMPVILMFCEEFLNLRRSMPPQYRDQALEDYTTLALRGRKRGMFLFSIGQTAYTERSIRDAQAQFLSSMAFAVKPTAARSAGFTNTELLNRLYSERKPGQFLLERPAGDAILQAPFVDTSAVTALLAPESSIESGPHSDDTEEFSNTVESGQQVDRNESRNQLESPLEAKSLQVRTLLSQGIINKVEIIQAVWNAKPGSSEKYRSAESEYKIILAQIAQKGIVT